MRKKAAHEDPGVMSLGLFALVVFLLVGTAAAVLGRNAGVDPNPMPFTSADSAADDSMTAGPVRTGMLPAEITESSGLAHSRRDPDIWYTHNDGSDGRVFAIRTDGSLVGTWRLAGHSPFDVEDIASGPCPTDGGMSCLYLADTGDNDRDRDDYTVYVVREPDLSSARDGTGTLELVAAQTFDYGGASRDAEALAIMKDGGLLIITKGQDEGAEMFRLPRLRPYLPGAPGRVSTAESLGMLPISVDRRADRVTGAAISPSGDVLAVRSDSGVSLFTMPGAELLTTCEVDSAGQQGEAVDFLDETTLLMTFEADGRGRAPIIRARCFAPDQETPEP